MGTEEIHRLARDFDTASDAVWQVAVDEFDELGEDFAEQWRENAMDLADGGLVPGSSGIGSRRARAHARAITSERKFTLGSTIVVEAGPEAGKKYGTMGEGFEFGSENSPPQLNGERALPVAEKRLDRMTGEVEDELP